MPSTSFTRRRLLQAAALGFAMPLAYAADYPGSKPIKRVAWAQISERGNIKAE